MAYEAVYDRADVGAIADRTTTEAYKNITLELRPLPNTNARDVLHAKILADTHDRLTGAAKSIPMDDIVSMRKRPLKETHSVVVEAPERTIKLIELGDRMIPLHIWTPAEAGDQAPLLLFLHGGGFCFGDVEAYVHFLEKIAAEADCVVAYPDYRFAPECPFPGPVEDCVGAYDWCVDHASELGIDTSRIIVAGDSAGGSLALAVVQEELDRNPVALAIPIYPVVDAAKDAEGRWSLDAYELNPDQREEEIYCINRTKGIGVMKLYTNNNIAELANPLISASKCTDEVLGRFPRTVMVTAQYDYLCVQDEDFACQLAAAGVDMRCMRYVGVNHGFIERTGTVPEGEDLAREIAREIERL